jgi:hypothetical protein
MMHHAKLQNILDLNGESAFLHEMYGALKTPKSGATRTIN